MARRRGIKSYVASVDDFLKASPWLTPADGPAVTSLQQMAKTLDAATGTDAAPGPGPSPALLGQFGLAYRNLLKREPGATGGDSEDDEIEGLLSGSGR